MNAKYSPLETNRHDNIVRKYVQIFFVVAAYWIISIVTVFVNKSLFSSKTINLDAPLFITWYQCVISALICFTMSMLSKKFPDTISFPRGNPFDKEIFLKVVPVSIFFVAMISNNNMCLKYVSVAFYYVGRSLTTVFNVVLSFMLLGQKTSFRCILCCAIIIAGFWIGVDQESITESFSGIGTIYGILGSLSLALYSIYTKKTLPFVNQEVWLLSYYNNVYSCVIFIPLMIFTGEIKTIYGYEYLTELWFWGFMTIGGVCGFAIGFVTALQIQMTSPLTHNISGTAKACAQTVLATSWYSEVKSVLWWISNVIVLAGSALYARFKQLEMVKDNKQHLAQKI